MSCLGVALGVCGAQGQWKDNNQHGCGVKVYPRPGEEPDVEAGEWIYDVYVGDANQCSVQEAFETAAEARYLAERARLFQGKPDGQSMMEEMDKRDAAGNLTRSAAQEIMMTQSGLHYPEGTQYLAPGPVGDAYAVPEATAENTLGGYATPARRARYGQQQAAWIREIYRVPFEEMAPLTAEEKAAKAKREAEMLASQDDEDEDEDEEDDEDEEEDEDDEEEEEEEEDAPESKNPAVGAVAAALGGRAASLSLSMGEAQQRWGAAAGRMVQRAGRHGRAALGRARRAMQARRQQQQQQGGARGAAPPVASLSMALPLPSRR